MPFRIFAPKINKIPEFYMIIARKIFSRIVFAGGEAVSYAYGRWPWRWLLKETTQTTSSTMTVVNRGCCDLSRRTPQHAMDTGTDRTNAWTVEPGSGAMKRQAGGSGREWSACVTWRRSVGVVDWVVLMNELCAAFHTVRHLTTLHWPPWPAVTASEWQEFAAARNETKSAGQFENDRWSKTYSSTAAWTKLAVHFT